MSVITIENLTKKYGSKTIFSDFNLEIQEREMVAISGKSGAGKSTLLNIMGLIEPFDSGKMKIFGTHGIKPNSSRAAKMIREHINYLFQNFALIDNETVFKNLSFALKYVNGNSKEKKKRIQSALQKVSLTGMEKQKVYTLSGGEQQRVAMARILIHPKPLILADEPTGSLDSQNRDSILSFLMELNHEGTTVVIVTHDPVVAKSCDRTVAL